jgi:hypothetical protein
MQQGAKSGTRSDGTALSKQYREWVMEKSPWHVEDECKNARENPNQERREKLLLLNLWHGGSVGDVASG